jgi:hypothetical protein
MASRGDVAILAVHHIVGPKSARELHADLAPCSAITRAPRNFANRTARLPTLPIAP